MSLWKKSNEKSADVERSAKLCKEREVHMLKFPGTMKAWNEEDLKVLKLAQEFAGIGLTENSERIIEARQVLQRAIWGRDGLKSDFQRKIDELDAQIEGLNSDAINEKCTEWRDSLSSLRDKKIIEKVNTRPTLDAGRMITYKSNFRTIAATKERVTSAISELRGMRQAPLSEVHTFIKKIETELSGTDFDAMKEEAEVTERTFDELCSRPEVTIYTTAQLIPGSRPGQERIQKNFDLPTKEYPK